MRHTADGGLKTPDARGETLSEMNIAPVAFNLNQSSAVCLPLVSDTKRLIWVHSDQIDLQLDGAAELDKAFNRFPYLTQKQTTELAQCCSLHPDQVRVWFMVQRLRYGISWDYKDILKVRRELKLSRGKEELQKNGGENDESKREVKESGGKKAGEVREGQSANEGRMKQEQPMKEEKDRKVKEDTGNNLKKQDRMAVTDTKRKKRRVEVDIQSDEAERESTKSKPAQSEWAPRKKKKVRANKRLLPIQEWPPHKSFVVPNEALDATSLLIPLSQTQVSDAPKLTENQNRTTPESSGFEGKTEVEAQLEEELYVESTNPTDVCKPEVTNNPVVLDGRTQVRCSAMTQTQLVMMKQAFAHCQYPDSEGYDQLAEMIGIPRYKLVQWYGDMRYYVKERKPGWLTEEQHKQALANIRYRQFLSTLAKVQQCGDGGNATLKMKLERS